jgi:BirA family biotin operon repressor/biotin-[acetyl-CoA-carboxylase] ligase
MKATLDPREVLQQLAHGGPVSGAELAAQLGVTRAAVWKQIEALRAAGLPIEARTKVGYCLPWPMELLDAERIQQALPNPAAPRASALGARFHAGCAGAPAGRRP